MKTFGPFTREDWEEYYGRPKPPRPITPEEIMSEHPCRRCSMAAGEKTCSKTVNKEAANYCEKWARWFGRWWPVVCREVRAMSKENDTRIDEEDRTQCPVCGRDVSTKWKYCPKCGELLLSLA